MAHLRTYKSFNLQEIEEIESRIFGPNCTNENSLKICPGTTNIPNIQYESVSGSCGQPSRTVQGDADKWESVQENIIRVLHHGKSYDDPMVVHINEDFLDEDDLESYEESNVYGIKTKSSDVTWPRHRLIEIKSEISRLGERVVSNVVLDKATETSTGKEVRGRATRFRAWFIKKCSCTKRETA